VAVVALVVGFGSSAGLASAYGIAVTGTLAIDTILFFVVVRMLWRKPLWLVLSGGAAFLVVDLAFFSANLPKVVEGGWFPLLLALVLFILLTTWQRGRELVTTQRAEAEGRLRDFVEEVRAIDPPVFRPPGTAVFLNASKQTTPLALRENLDYNHVLHQCVVVVSVETHRVPHVDRAERVVAAPRALPHVGKPSRVLRPARRTRRDHGVLRRGFSRRTTPVRARPVSCASLAGAPRARRGPP